MAGRALAVLVIVGLLVAWLFTRKGEASASPEPAVWTNNMASWIDNLTQDASKNEALYRDAVLNAEKAHGLPPGLLGRLLYQESRYRTDIITGKVKSKAGAMGIAQFMPATAAEMGLDPLDPIASINGAARYLAMLNKKFGNWRVTLAAYNFGQGNISRGKVWPMETQAYVNDIANDVGLA